MRSVLCFGEALIDFLYQDVIAQDKLSLPAFRQYPGGAPANASVAVAKLGGRARFAGQVGNDAFGDFLQNALMQNGVDVTLLARHPSAQTALAFVMLDDSGDRSFSFYRDNSADLLFDAKQLSEDWFADTPILHFCSNTLTTEYIASCTKKIVAQARKSKSLVSFDVNLRHNLWSAKRADPILVNSLVLQSDLVKFSKEELLYLAGNNPKPYIAKLLTQQCKLLVVTDGENRIEYFSKEWSAKLQPPKVTVVDTTAGGDGFVGGMLYVLSQLPDPIAALSEQKIVAEIIAFASCCGALAVSKPGAFPALPDSRAALNMFEKNHGNTHVLYQFLGRNI